MSFAKPGTALESVSKQLVGLGMGALSGGLTKHAIPLTKRASNGVVPQTAMQVGSAMGAAVSNNAGISGAVAAGVGVITGKTFLINAAATAAAPAVALAVGIGGIGYGLYKLLK